MKVMFVKIQITLSNLYKFISLDSISSSDELMKVVSLLVTRPQSRNRFEIPFSGDQHR